MTDTGPATPVGDIVVRGQRRRPGGAFPSRTSPGGGAGDDGGAQQDEFADREGELAVSSADPCADPETALTWNADAAAAAAVAALAAKAQSLQDGSNLSNREFGANLIRNADGSVGLTAVEAGSRPISGQIPRVNIPHGGATYQNWMGDVHNHPSGESALSDLERDAFIANIERIERDHPERSEIDSIAAYVVVLDANAPRGYRIFAHTRNTPPDAVGLEVNPDAQPCPGGAT